MKKDQEILTDIKIVASELITITANRSIDQVQAPSSFICCKALSKSQSSLSVSDGSQASWPRKRPGPGSSSCHPVNQDNPSAPQAELQAAAEG